MRQEKSGASYISEWLQADFEEKNWGKRKKTHGALCIGQTVWALDISIGLIMLLPHLGCLLIVSTCLLTYTR